MPYPDYHICKVCRYQVEWKLDEEIDDYGWWCETCEEWCADEDVEKVIELDRQEIAYKKARRRGWED